MKRTICLWLMVVTLIFTLTSCKTSESEKDVSDVNSVTSEQENDDVDEGDSTNVDVDEEPDEKSDLPEIDLYSLFRANTPTGYYATSFSNRVNELKSYRGESVYQFDDGESEYYISKSGKSMITTIKGHTLKILRSVPDAKKLFEENDNTAIITLYGYEDMLDDGYVMIANKKETYNGTTYQLGFMKETGEWITELKESHAILSVLGNDVSMDVLSRMRYVGEGKITVCSKNNGSYLYDIAKDTIVKFHSDDNSVSESTIDDVVNCGLEFSNGKAFSTYGSFWGGTFAYVFSVDGNAVYQKFDLPIDGVCGRPYYDRDNGLFYYMGWNYSDSGMLYFVDSTGKIIKKISCNIDSENGFRNDKTAQLIAKNNEGSYFYMVVDIYGEFAFEPVQVSGREVRDLNGYEVGIENYSILVDDEGHVLATLGREDGVRNGVVYVNGEYHLAKDLVQ